MKFHTFGDPSKPAFMTLPGTICHWSAGFDTYREELQKFFYVVMVSYDGFDETEDTIYPDMPTEAERIERYVQDNLSGRVFCTYGCSLGGSFAAYLLARRRIRMDHIIIGSSDLDQASVLGASLQAALVSRILHGLLQSGKLPDWMQKRMDRSPEEKRAYSEQFMKLLSSRDMSFVKKQSVRNQFYSDLVTPLPDKLEVPGSQIHVFYAKKMGEKYLGRYMRHFARPDIRTHDMEHEELFICHPDLWMAEVLDCCGMKEKI